MTSTITDRFNVAPEEGTKAPCRMATTANVTLSGLQTIDGVAGAANDRVLVKDQTDATENGIYLMSSTAWSRAPDWNDSRDASPGVLIPVSEGSAYSSAVFQTVFTSPLSVGSTQVNFVQNQNSLRFSTKASLAAAVLPEGIVVSTRGYYDGWAAFLAPQGAGDYDIALLSDVRTAKSDVTWVPDGFVNFFIANSSGTTHVAMLKFDGEITSKQAGAKADNVADDTLPLQAGINYTALYGAVFKITAGTYSVRKQAEISARGYSLLIPSNSTIIGDGVEKTIISAFNDALIWDVITDDRNNPSTNIKLDGFTVFGDHDNRPKGGIGIWFQNCTQLTIGEIFVNKMTGFGVRLNTCSKVYFDTIRVESTKVQPNDDGIHFYDCNTVVGNKAVVKTAGDDCFIITAELADCYDISVDQVVVSSPTGNRGLLLNLGDSADAMHSIYNVKIGVVANDCPNGAAAILYRAAFDNIDINVQSKGCENAFRVDLASIGFGKGSLRNSRFNVESLSDIEHGVFVLDGDVIEGNEINAIVYNNGDGFEPVSLQGTGWTGSVSVNHDPDSTKVSPKFGLDTYTISSMLDVRVVNANGGVNLRSTAQNNTFNLVSKNTVSHSVANNSGTSVNMFVGGEIDSTVNLPNNNEFFGVRGADTRGNSNLAVDGSGIITIPHGLTQSPGHVVATYSGANAYTARHSSSDATNIYIGLFDAAGAAVTTGTHRIMWQASL